METSDSRVQQEPWAKGFTLPNCDSGGKPGTLSARGNLNTFLLHVPSDFWWQTSYRLPLSQPPRATSSIGTPGTSYITRSSPRICLFLCYYLVSMDLLHLSHVTQSSRNEMVWNPLRLLWCPWTVLSWITLLWSRKLQFQLWFRSLAYLNSEAAHTRFLYIRCFSYI